MEDTQQQQQNIDNNEYEKELLELITDAPFFNLNNQQFQAKVTYVYDGDTIHCVFAVFQHMFKWRCRLAHIDTPELRTKNITEKQHGYVVKEKVKELLLGKIVTLYALEFDKYGRLLVEIETENPDSIERETIPTIRVHEWLLSNNYAYKYEGKTKKEWVFNDDK
jgi:endonuclease YncB( thermonuclease family)